jgi:phage baseplate assembly protein W
MLKNGNGDPQRCTENLLQTPRFSVPYDRLKGIDGDLIDTPASTAPDDMAADAEWLIETYEPRARINSIEALNPDGIGEFGISADISVNYMEDDDE